MTGLSRRTFLAGTAAVVVTPALPALPAVVTPASAWRTYSGIEVLPFDTLPAPQYEWVQRSVSVTITGERDPFWGQVVDLMRGDAQLCENLTRPLLSDDALPRAGGWWLDDEDDD